MADSLAVGQPWQNDQRVLLIVKMKSDETLTETLKSAIREEIKKQALLCRAYAAGAVQLSTAVAGINKRRGKIHFFSPA